MLLHGRAALVFLEVLEMVHEQIKGGAPVSSKKANMKGPMTRVVLTKDS